jgi:hypothetical protein
VFRYHNITLVISFLKELTDFTISSISQGKTTFHTNISEYFPAKRKWEETLAIKPEAEFLDVIGTKISRVFLLAFHSHLYKQILLPPSSSAKVV